MPIDAFTTVGSFTWTNPGVSEVEVLVVAGGGGGGGTGGGSAGGGGGGAGGVVYNGSFSVSGDISGSVGAGGSAGGDGFDGNGGDGSNSTFGTITANGGGGGGSRGSDGSSGGCGGGAGSTGSYSGGNGNQGGNGGDVTGNASADNPAAGGGGASQDGETVGATGIGGDGGDGEDWSGTFGTTYGEGGVFAGGGGGGDGTGAAEGGVGGTGGGGSIGDSSTMDGQANTGGGGAGQSTEFSEPPGSGGSGIVLVKYQDPEPPAAPSGLSGNSPGDVTINLTWTDNSDTENGFYIYRSTTSGSTTGDYTQIDSVGENTTSYSDSGLQAGETYYYRVSAFNDFGESSLSNEISVTANAGRVFGTEQDWDFAIDEARVVHDDLADHQGSGTIQMGYDVGSLTEGLVAYYPLVKGDGRVAHDGALENLGQINGATWAGSGQLGESLSFDGTDDYADLGNSIDSVFTGPFTVCLWCNMDSADADQLIFDHDGTVVRLTHGYTSSSFEFGIFDGATNNISSGDSTTGSWVHLAGTFDGSQMELYLDGVSQGTQSSNTPREDNQGSAIGAIEDGSDLYFGGDLNDVRIYDRVLSPIEIQALANRTSPSGRPVTESDVPSNDDGGIVRYEFEGDVNDSWGSNDGTDNTSAGYVDGVYGQAKDFDGSDDYITATLSSIDTTTAFTMGCWFKNDEIGSGNTETLLGLDNPSNSEFIEVNDSTSDTYKIASNGHTAGDGSTVESGWNHVILVYDGSGLFTLYIDGSIDYSVDGGTGWQSGMDTLYIGSDEDGASDYLDGQIDDVRIYNTALSPTEVEQLYNLGATRIPRGDVL